MQPWTELERPVLTYWSALANLLAQKGRLSEITNILLKVTRLMREIGIAFACGWGAYSI